MTSATARLLFLRLAGILTQGFLLTAATVLFAFGMLELFQVLALLVFALTWLVLRPAAAHALARSEYAEHGLARAVDAAGAPLANAKATGITEAQYASLRAILVRRRVRKSVGVPRDRFDSAQAILTTLAWLAYLGFYSSVAVAGGA